MSNPPTKPCPRCDYKLGKHAAWCPKSGQVMHVVTTEEAAWSKTITVELSVDQARELIRLLAMAAEKFTSETDEAVAGALAAWVQHELERQTK